MVASRLRVVKTRKCNDCYRNVQGGVTGSLEAEYCYLCCEYAGWENTHQDNDHETLDENDPERKGCMVCEGWDPNADKPAADEKPKAKGHSNGIAKSNTSHTGCAHESTKSARAACRKKRAAEAAK